MRTFTTAQMQEVLDLTNRGWSTPKIAEHCEMSQEDVRFIREKSIYAIGIAKKNDQIASELAARQLEQAVKPPDVFNMKMGESVLKKAQEFNQAVFGLGDTVASTNASMENLVSLTKKIQDENTKALEQYFAERESWLREPVKVPSKELLRQKLLNAPLRNNIKLYAAAIHVHGMNREDLMQTFGLRKNSVHSIEWQVKTDLALNKIL